MRLVSGKALAFASTESALVLVKGLPVRPVTRMFLLAVLASTLMTNRTPTGAKTGETLEELTARLAVETNRAYEASPYSALSRDYFSRFSRDPNAEPGDGETALDDTWRIVLPLDADPLAELMTGHFVDFLDRCMGLRLPVETRARSELDAEVQRTIVFLDSGGGDPDVPESFTIAVKPGEVRVHGRDPRGLRNGVVKLVDQIGFRQVPIVALGQQVYRPRLKVRLGAVPKFGSYRDVVFMGYNAVLVGGGSLYALSKSDAIPELAGRRQPGSLEAGARAAQEARQYGLKTYCFINTRQKFSKDDPVFLAHPEIRGALTWKADGEYVLCTEHPLVRRYLSESVRAIFQSDPALDGLVLIIGGEGFYHCYMRPYGVKKGHTNCKRCEALGAETVVSNLCNYLAEEVRKVNPRGEIVAWPYSAEHVWSADDAQAALISRLQPGVAIFTEIEKDEFVQKPDGVTKHIWDYSIDLIGPGDRAQRQVEACKAAGISIYMKSEPELGFEAPRLPHIPCMDRWVARAEALASCGADGAWVFPAFRPCYGTSAAEINKFVWWEPVPDKETLLQEFAARLGGERAGPHVRRAWKHVSDAIEFSPELPSYYTGPYYLGPAHPMRADPEASVPDVFYGRYLFHAEIADAEGLKLEPTFVTSPTGNVPVFGEFYRKMEACLKRAVDEMDAARPLVPERCRLTFDAEDSPIRWFYHTARTEANFYESCQLRDRLLAFATQESKSPEQIAEARRTYERWREVLLDEKANASEALPVMEADVRLDFYYGSDHTFSHGADTIRAKLELIDREINEFLPALAAKCGFSSTRESESYQ